MSRAWWERNRLWLLLLLPLLALALAATSFRLVTLYLPWEWSRPLMANGTEGTLRQTFLGTDDVRRGREVTVTAVEFVTVDEFDTAVPPPGATLRTITLAFDADPDQILDRCTVIVVDTRGNQYAAGKAGTISTDPRRSFVLDSISCVPYDTPGPTMGSDEVIEPKVPRPRTWSVTLPVALPDDATPAELRIGWSQPEYLILGLPE